MKDTNTIKVTEHGKTTKLHDIPSVSTSAKLNPYCIEHAKHDGNICQKCYANNYIKLRPTLAASLERNTKILTERILNDDELFRFYSLYGRLESFGDLINEIQVVNYFRACELNSKTNMALWTKNPWIISRAMKEYGIKKPSNLQILYSSPKINRRVNIERFRKVFPFIDKVFTVFTKDYAKENNIDINCGSRDCIGACGCKCYLNNNVEYINELLK